MEKCIKLIPLAEIGKGYAFLRKDSIRIEVEGINGSMKAWLIGGEAEEIGNIVMGKLERRVDTTGHTGVLITQSGRQMMVGKYGDELQNHCISPEPFSIPGFNWKRYESGNYEKLCRELRFIMSNRAIYNNYKKYGHYWIGESSNGSAVALKYCEKDNDPLEFAGKMKLSQNGYAIVCVDKKTKKLYIPKN